MAILASERRAAVPIRLRPPCQREASNDQRVFSAVTLRRAFASMSAMMKNGRRADSRFENRTRLALRHIACRGRSSLRRPFAECRGLSPKGSRIFPSTIARAIKDRIGRSVDTSKTTTKIQSRTIRPHHRNCESDLLLDPSEPTADVGEDHRRGRLWRESNPHPHCPEENRYRCDQVPSSRQHLLTEHE
jgi:hypothetical protein